MSLSNNDRRTSITATGGQTLFTPDFQLYGANEVEVRQTIDLTGATVTLTGGGVDYTVTESTPGVYPTSFTITLTTGAAVDDVIVIDGDRPVRSDSAFTTGGDLLATTVNKRIDEAGAERQELRRDLDTVVAAVDSIIGTIGDPIITGLMTPGTIPVATAPDALGDSLLTQSGSAVTMTGTFNVTGVANLDGGVVVTNDAPGLTFDNTAAAADNRIWTFGVAGTQMFIAAFSNDLLAFQNAMLIDRSGSTITRTRFQTSGATRLDINGPNVAMSGNLDVTGVIEAGSSNVTLTSAAGRLLLAALDTTGASNSMVPIIVAGVPTWQYLSVVIDLSNPAQITGVLPIANGGTGASLASVTNRVLYGTGASAFGTSANLTFNGTLLTAAQATVAGQATFNGAVALSSTSPGITFSETGAGVNTNERNWNIIADGGQLTVDLLNDSFAGTVTAITITRSGTTPTGVIVNAPLAAQNLTLGTDDTSAGSITVYGNNAATGALLSLYNAANEDTTVEAWLFEANDSLRIGYAGNADLFILTTTGAVLTSASPGILFTESDGGFDAKNWNLAFNGGAMSIDLLNDVLGGPVNLLTVTRSGTAIGNVTLNGTVILGTVDINGGAIDGTVIGAAAAAAATVTALTATGAVALSPANANVVLSPTGTGLVTINPATAGTMNNVAIGGTTPLAGTFTTITANTSLTVASDTDAVTILGRLRIDSRTTDVAYLSHFDQTGANAWGLSLNSSGATFVNAASGQSVAIRVNGSNKLTVSSTAINVSGGYLIHGAGAELTVSAGGAITVTNSYHRVQPAGGTGSDDLDTINGGATEGQILTLYPPDSGDTIVLRHNVGNIYCPSAANISIIGLVQMAKLFFNGTQWVVMSPRA